MQRTLPLELSYSAENNSYSKRATLYHKYSEKFIVSQDLNRALVSFQANKQTPFYRWMKYKEAFSSELVRYFIEKFRPAINSVPCILDPFAGVGTTLSTASRVGWHATGIEILPVGVAAIRARLLADEVNIRAFQYHLSRLKKLDFDSRLSNHYRFPHLAITKKAFPKLTEYALSAYTSFLDGIKNSCVRYLFWFACLSILEEVSHTRKDGQYLRWDFRSGRALKSTFNKGIIHEFRSAINSKLEIMLEDIKKPDGKTISQNVKIIEGSCLTELPNLPDSYFNLVITSPPYCNRYDYTRTYALELAFLGCDEQAIKHLRQSLLSATVENKSKRLQLDQEYRSRSQEDRYNKAVDAFTQQEALQEVLSILCEARTRGKLNNNSIPSLVENYFFEMNIVIHELARVLAPGGHIIMVNDNVQYNGEEIPVDLILSDFASSAGLSVDNIWVLPRGKGNSSQQMGIYGRKEIRKDVYLWSKTT